ncbi:MAG: hypothetical protein AAB474_01645 [Patescibacteria group bacterium]
MSRSQIIVVNSIYCKTKLHLAKHKRYKYISGRLYCVRSDALSYIPKESVHDDMYFNLIVDYHAIDIDEKAKVYYHLPDNIKDFIRYKIRLGRALASIRYNFSSLWKEQQRRISLIDYAVFGLTRFRFFEFFLKLNFIEKLIFILLRVISASAMFYGFSTYRKTKNRWNTLKSTKMVFF